MRVAPGVPENFRVSAFNRNPHNGARTTGVNPLPPRTDDAPGEVVQQEVKVIAVRSNAVQVARRVPSREPVCRNQEPLTIRGDEISKAKVPVSDGEARQLENLDAGFGVSSGHALTTHGKYPVAMRKKRCDRARSTAEFCFEFGRNEDCVRLSDPGFVAVEHDVTRVR